MGLAGALGSAERERGDPLYPFMLEAVGAVDEDLLASAPRLVFLAKSLGVVPEPAGDRVDSAWNGVDRSSTSVCIEVMQHRAPLLVLAAALASGAIVSAQQATRLGGAAQRDAQPILGALVPGQLDLVATFESVSVYATYSGDSNTDGTAVVEYRELPGGTWTTAHPPWADRGERELRTSLVELTPDREHQVRVPFVDPDGVIGSPTLLETVPTWDESPDIGTTHTLMPGTYDSDSMSLQSGSASAWTLYQGSGLGPVVFHDPNPLAWGFSVVEEEYIIFRNLTFTGGRDAVVVYNSDHIRFENCEFREFGDAANPTKPHRGIVMRGADCAQVVVQDCRFHSPLGSANDWDTLNWMGTLHPDGPYAVWFWESGGNHVVRRNRIEGDDQHWWSDGICGNPNGGVNGGPHRDTDIQDNVVHHANDDGIELDGGQMNVRCSGNEISRCYVAISTAPCIEGPAFIYRNVIWNMGDGRTPPESWTLFKLGGAEGNPGVGKGSQFIYHNTMHAPYDPNGVPPYEVWMYSGISGTTYGNGPGANKFINVTSRNNIILAGEAAVRDRYFYDPPGTNSFDYDLAHQDLALSLGDPAVLVPEEHGVHAPLGTTIFVDAVGGDFHLAAGSPAIDRGVEIPGFSGGVIGGGPDLGAFEDF